MGRKCRSLLCVAHLKRSIIAKMRREIVLQRHLNLKKCYSSRGNVRTSMWSLFVRVFFLGFHSDRFRLYLQFTITGESSNGSDTYTVNIISFLAKLAELSPPLLRTTLEHSSLKNKFVVQRPYEASFVSPFPEQHHHGSINEVFSLCMSERLDEYYSSYELIKQCCKIEFYTRI